MPVQIISTHTGVGVGPDGGSHQALEDIALMRVIPNMQVIVPCDFEEARKATIAISKTAKPNYLRLVRENTRDITTAETPFEIAKAQVFWESENPEITIIAVGPMVEQALLAAQELADEGIPTVVINSATIKPLDEKTILYWAQKTNAVVSAEIHQKIGGLGGALAELFAEKYPVAMEQVAVNNKFGQSGTNEELMKYYHVDKDAIVTASKKIISRKSLTENNL
jgi:transketolase